MIAHHEAWELLPDVAAGVCGADERAALDEHLDACPICRAELDTLRSAVELLSGAPALLDPPNKLRARVMAIPDLVEREPLDDHVRVLRRPRRSAGGFLSGRRLGIVAAAVAVAAVALMAAVIGLRGDDFQTARSISMKGTGGAWARAQIGRSSGGDVALRLKAHLPPVGKGWYYEVWLGKPDQRLSIGDFTVGHGDNADVRMNIPRGASDEYLWIWVTREQDDGNPGPGPVVLRAKLA